MNNFVNDVDFQMENLKKVKYNSMITKKVLICFHGLETNTRHDLTSFKEYFDEYNKNNDFEVVLASLYDVGDKKSYHSKKMYKRACNIVEEYQKKGYTVCLLGYSFSCGIVAHLAHDYKKVQKLVFASPIISLVNTSLITNYIKVALHYFKLRIKYGKKSKVVLEKTKNRSVVKLSLAVSRSLSHNRKYFKNLKNEIFIFKGKEDNFSLNQTYKYIAKHNNNSLIKTKFYPKGDHLKVMFKESGEDCYSDIIKFVFDISISLESVKFNDED